MTHASRNSPENDIDINPRVQLSLLSCMPLTGPLPEAWSAWSGLYTMYLNSNALTGMCMTSLRVILAHVHDLTHAAVAPVFFISFALLDIECEA